MKRNAHAEDKMGNATAFGTRFRDVDLTTFDTSVALEHAKNQALQRHYEDFLIVDVDSHHRSAS